ncbi:RutC family protein [Smittium mucronatum]|uniref:RutC family protein n=1 Tax=Smittium mucronatum TaxID=133383 RepID=A0A1R0H8D6_9FUNG|nr:RutC family protein [Smittium mucronatum]
MFAFAAKSTLKRGAAVTVPRALASCANYSTSKEAIHVPNSKPAIGPYSKGILFGNLIFTSGQLPTDPNTNELLGNDIKTQTEAAIANLQSVLKSAGSDLNKVIKTTVYLSDIKEWEEMNSVYQKYFDEPYPARSAFEVGKLPKGSKVEIECVAHV